MVFCTPTILSLTSRFNPRKSRKVLTIPWSKDGAQIGHGNPHETGAHTIKLSTVVAHLWLLFFEQFLDMMIGYDVGRHGMKDNYMIMRRRYKLILPGFNISIPRIFFGRPWELSPFQRGTNGSQAFHRTEQTHHDNVLRIRTTSSTTAGKWHLRFRIRRSPAGGEQHRSPPPKPRKITWRLQVEISWNDHHHRHTHYFTHLCLVSETQWSKRRPSPQAPESFPSNSWSWVTLKKVDPPPNKAHQGTSTVSNQLAPSQKKAQPGEGKNASPITQFSPPHLRSMQIFDVSLTNPKRYTYRRSPTFTASPEAGRLSRPVGPNNLSYNLLLHSPVTYIFLTFPKIEAGESPQFHGTQVFQDGWVDSESLS